MVNKKTGIIFSLSLLFLMFSLGIVSAFSGVGAGSLSNPFNITNCTQLAEIDDDSSANYSLVNDIDFNSSLCSQYTQGNGWLPLGKMGGAFIGTLFGNNYVISNLYIKNSIDNPAGLFGNASLSSDYYGKVYDLGLEDVNITANESVGGLIGYGRWVIINNSYVTGDISGNFNVGGLLGFGDFSSVSNSYSNVLVNGGDYTGGLVGDGNGIEINNSFALGDVVGDYYTGGVIGSATNSVISGSYAIGNVNGSSMVGGLSGSICCGSDPGQVFKSYARGNVFGTSNWVGGLIGDGSDGVINISFASGKVEGVTYVGGLVGEGQNLTVFNSYSTGNVTGSNYVGGLVGFLHNDGTSWGLINYSYSTGNVVGSINVGGLVGNLTNSVINASYYDTNTSGKSDTGRGEPMTTLNMKNFALYLGKWDITTVATGETDLGNLWNIVSTVIYPFLSWQDITAPVVHLVAPLNNSISPLAEVNHSFNVTDESSLVSCTMYWADFSIANSVLFNYLAPDGLTLEVGSLTSTDGTVTWKVNCTDLAGNVGSSETWSYLVRTIPQITSVSSGDPSTTSATITWTTSEESNATVNYGTSASLGTFNTLDSLGLSQSVSLSGLTSNTLYFYNVTSCDASANCNTTGPHSFSTDSESSGGGSSGGGGGGGGAPTVSNWVKEIKLNGSELNLGQTLKLLKEKYRLTFNVSGMGHSLQIFNISSTEVTFEVASTPQVATLLIGQIKKFDVNADNIYDLSVGLISIYNKTADLSIKTINEAMPNTGAISSSNGTSANITNGAVDTELIGNFEESSSLKIIIIVGVIILLLVIFGIFYFRNVFRKN